MSSAPHNPDRTEERLDRLEQDVAAIKARLDAELPHLATKADLANVRTELAELRADMERNFRRMQAWMIGTTVTLIGAMAACTAAAIAIFRYTA